VPEGGLKADDLARRVDAGVGTAGELNHDRLSGNAQQQLLQHALHRADVRLHLKAMEVGTVVLDDNFDF